MGSIPPELSLEMKPVFVPKSITQFLAELETIGDVSERSLRLDDFVLRLEEEMKKIDAFKRELPLCMIITNDAIATLKEESMKCRTREFIPLKKSNDKDEEMKAKDDSDLKDKKNWMSSVQLWNIDDHKTDKSQQNRDTQLLKVGEDYQLVSGDLLQSNKEITRPKPLMPSGGSSVFPLIEKDYKGKAVAELSLVLPETKNLMEDSGSSGFKPKTMFSQRVLSPTPIASSSLQASQHNQSGRKQRRCWSPELHRRFVSALQQLGGSQVATPKQIRELMQVDGLTNDEVKSHLQKYRLHMRRLPNSGAAPPNHALVLWEDQSGESSKQSRSQSRSPAGPLQLPGASMEEDEEGEEEKSENYTSKRHSQS